MSQNIDFQYKYIEGDSWASGFIRTDQHTFEFDCSYLFNNPLEELLNAVYQIVPGLAAFPRNEIEFTMLDEPIEYRWVFTLIDDKHVKISIYEKGYDLNTKLVFKDSCNLKKLIKALVQCVGSHPMLRSNEKIERTIKGFKTFLKSQ